MKLTIKSFLILFSIIGINVCADGGHGGTGKHNPNQADSTRTPKNGLSSVEGIAGGHGGNGKSADQARGTGN